MATVSAQSVKTHPPAQVAKAALPTSRRWTRGLSCLAFILSCSLPSVDEVHAAQWARTYGGTGNDDASSVYATPDGGYIVAGGFFSPPFTNLGWVQKLDGNGGIAWQKGFAGFSAASFGSALPTSDGGYIISGAIGIIGTCCFDAWVLKLDASGNVMWQNDYGDGGNPDLQPTADGGYVLAGTEHSGFASENNTYAWVQKLDASGNVVWRKSYGRIAAVQDEGLNSVQPTSDGGYIAAGVSRFDPWVLKLDASGGIVWQKVYHDPVFLGSSASAVQVTVDGGYIVAGRKVVGPFTGDAWLLKLDASGNVIWQKTYGGAGEDEARSVKKTPDGGYIVAGNTQSFGAGGYDAWLLKLTSNGDITWQKTYGGPGDDFARSVQLTADGGYIVAGDTNSFGAGGVDAWVLKLDAGGNISGCANVGTSNATGVNSHASTLDGTTTIVSTFSVPPQSTSSIPVNTAASSSQQCRFDALVATAVPTLSAWATLLMSSLLGLAAVAAGRRCRWEWTS